MVATAKTKGRRTNKINNSEQAAIELLSSEKYELTNGLEYTRHCMKTYGEQTIENRAIPDYRDGLIPVQRRILYAMYRQNQTNLVKSARVVGDVLGKWHPHGDSAAYGAMTTLVQAPIKLIEGSGNWGSYDDPKSVAAMRYTECKLSDLARKIFFNGYLSKVYDLIPNFDNTEQEPAVLHCNIPVALVLGKLGGIAVGAVCNIPSYTLESVCELTKIALGGKKITAKMCYDQLEFNFSWGGTLAESHYADGSYLNVVKTGSGSLAFRSTYEVDAEAGTMKITSIPPNVNYTGSFNKTAELGVRIDDFTTVTSDGIEIIIDLTKSDEFGKLKRKTDGTYIIPKELIAQVEKIWTGKSIAIRCAITDRQMTDEALLAGASAMDISFAPAVGIADFINKWVEYRLALEIHMAEMEREDLNSRVDKLNLIIWAREHLDDIKKALDQADPIGYMAKKFKMDIEDMKYVFSRTLIQLSKTDINESENKILDLKRQIKDCTKRMKNPAPSTIEAVDSILN